MSLATRCTACGTVFRVVQDQLKVSEGWVRCGRCDEVFNALEGLFDLEREPMPSGPMPAASSAPKPGTPHAPMPTPHDAGGDDSVWPTHSPADNWEPSLAERLGAELLSSEPGELGPSGSHASSALHDASAALSSVRWDAELLTEAAAQETELAEYSLDEPALERNEGPSHAAEPGAPEFLRHADRQARWRRPKVRLLMASLGLLLAAGLGLQMAHHFRDTVAARWPQTRPALLAWCAALKCTLESPRRIEDISVESTTLARASPTTEAFRLSVNLRNRGALPLGVPSVDLKLTDGSGALVARRMLSPRDFGIAVAALPPGSETMLQMLLSTGSLGVTGYTVEVFYP